MLAIIKFKQSYYFFDWHNSSLNFGLHNYNTTFEECFIMSSLECRIALIRETERHPGDGRRVSLSSTGLRLKSIIQDSHNSSYFLMTLKGNWGILVGCGARELGTFVIILKFFISIFHFFVC